MQNAEAINFLIANASVYVQLAPLTPGAEADWGPELLFAPMTGQFTNAGGIRFRSAIAGTPAQVIAQLIQPADAQPAAGTPYTQTLLPSGAVGSIVDIPIVTLANWPPASPQDTQAVYLVLPSSYDPVLGKPTRWLCQYDASNSLWHVAGPPLVGWLTPDESTASGSYGDLATVGPSVTIPRPGNYDVEFGAGISVSNPGGAVAAYMSAGGIVTPSDSYSARATSSFVGAALGASGVHSVPLAIASTGAVTAKYRVQGANNGEYYNRWIKAHPRQIT